MNNGIGTGGREGDPKAQEQEGEEGQEEEEQVTGNTHAVLIHLGQRTRGRVQQ